MTSLLDAAVPKTSPEPSSLTSLTRWSTFVRALAEVCPPDDLASWYPLIKVDAGVTGPPVIRGAHSCLPLGALGREALIAYMLGRGASLAFVGMHEAILHLSGPAEESVGPDGPSPGLRPGFAGVGHTWLILRAAREYGLDEEGRVSGVGAKKVSGMCAAWVAGTVSAVLKTPLEGIPFWVPPPRKPRVHQGHVYTVCMTKQGLSVRGIKIPKLDKTVSLGEEFEAFDAELRARIKSGTKGLILLHGAPGTGKTTYIRQLIHACDALGKRIILIPRSMIDIFSGPSLVSLLPKLAKTPSVLVVEDAEPLLGLERQEGTSTLLNLTDGLLNDVAKTQVIVTFNAKIDKIDPALTRDGRLLANWEFKALSVEAGKIAALDLGLDPNRVTTPMTIAQIAATKPITSKAAGKNPVGFGS